MGKKFNAFKRYALVTGAASGMGQIYARRLALMGYSLVLVDINAMGLEQTTLMVDADVRDAMGIDADMKARFKVLSLVQDLSAQDAADAVFARTEAEGCKVEVLVNNAGGLVGRKTIEEQDEEWFDTLLNLNFKSCWLCTRDVLKYMEKGSIVNISSQAARDGGGPGSSLYAAGKAAMLCHTRAMAKELGPRGVRVNSVCPGMINTYFHDTFTPQAGRENLHRTAPLRREGEAYEVADLVSYLASDESSYITGNGIDINGGCLFS